MKNVIFLKFAFLLKLQSQSDAFLPVRSWVVPEQFLDRLAGLGYAEPKLLQVECAAQVEEVRVDETSEGEAVEEEQQVVDWVDTSCFVCRPDESMTAPLVPSALPAAPPTQNDPPWK